MVRAPSFLRYSCQHLRIPDCQERARFGAPCASSNGNRQGPLGINNGYNDGANYPDSMKVLAVFMSQAPLCWQWAATAGLCRSPILLLKCIILRISGCTIFAPYQKGCCGGIPNCVTGMEFKNKPVIYSTRKRTYEKPIFNLANGASFPTCATRRCPCSEFRLQAVRTGNRVWPPAFCRRRGNESQFSSETTDWRREASLLTSAPAVFRPRRFLPRRSSPGNAASTGHHH